MSALQQVCHDLQIGCGGAVVLVMASRMLPHAEVDLLSEVWSRGLSFLVGSPPHLPCHPCLQMCAAILEASSLHEAAWQLFHREGLS